MKILLKVTAVILTIIALLAIGAYFAFEPAVTSAVRREINELELPPDWELTFEDVLYKAPNTITVTGIELASLEKTFSLKELSVRPDLWSLFRKKTLSADIDLVSFEYDDLAATVSLNVYAPPAEDIKEALEMETIERITIFSGGATYKGHELENIRGEVLLDKARISSVRVNFLYAEEEAHLEIEDREPSERDLLVRASYPEFKLTGRFTEKDDDLLIRDLEASYYGITVRGEGAVYSYLTPQPQLRMEGRIRSDLEDLTKLPLKNDPLKELPLKGSLNADMTLSSKGPDIKDLEITSDIRLSRARFDKFDIGDMTARMELKGGILALTEIRGEIYEGAFSADLVTDLASPDKVFQTDLKLTRTRLGKLVNELTGKRTRVVGDLDGRVFLSGHLNSPETFSGGGSLHAYNADLGPMPILAPLVGNLYGLIQQALPFAEDLSIREGYTEFRIEDENVSTDSIVLIGKQVLIQGRGRVNFDGELDFYFENQLIEPEEAQELESWQRTLHDAMIRFGRMLSKARLVGTLKDPEWRFEYRDPLSGTIERGIRKLLDIF